jgi:IS4 transposase
LRVAGVSDETTGEYHLHLTNIEPERLPAQDVQTAYALRWQIELLFKERKSN